jgi:hypothetical protein
MQDEARLQSFIENLCRILVQEDVVVMFGSVRGPLETRETRFDTSGCLHWEESRVKQGDRRTREENNNKKKGIECAAFYLAKMSTQ